MDGTIEGSVLGDTVGVEGSVVGSALGLALAALVSFNVDGVSVELVALWKLQKEQ